MKYDTVKLAVTIMKRDYNVVCLQEIYTVIYSSYLLSLYASLSLLFAKALLQAFGEKRRWEVTEPISCVFRFGFLPRGEMCINHTLF